MGFDEKHRQTRVRFMAGNSRGLESGSSRVASPNPSLGSYVARRAELPVLEVAVVRERADDARNRLRVLAAAERLFAQHGVSGVTMDDVAAAAGWAREL